MWGQLSQLRLAAGVLACQVGCGGSMTESPVVQTVVDVLQTEDRMWQEVCSDLGKADGVAGPVLLAQYQVRESINDVKALHDALRMQKDPLPACSALRTSNSTLGAAETCLTELRNSWDQAGDNATRLADDAKDLADNAKKLFEIVQEAVNDPITAVRDLTRQLNFSLVVLVRMAEIAQVSEQTIDDVTESLGWWSAAVRIPLKLVVAEVLVRLNEIVMMEVERLGWITPSDTARNSCKLLEQGSYRTTVQTRLLRRTVLRFGERTAAEPCDSKVGACMLKQQRKQRRAPGVEGLCYAIDEESNDVCRRALKRMRIRQREIDETLDPTHLLIKAAPEWHDFDPGIKLKAEAMLAAAPVCEQIDPSMGCLSDVSSIFIFAPTTIWKDRSLDLSEIKDIRAQLSEMRGAVGSLHTEMRRSLNQVHEDNRAAFDSIHQIERLVSGPLTRKIEAALVERCAVEIGDIQEKRIVKTAKMLKGMFEKMKESSNEKNQKEPPSSLTCSPPLSAERYDITIDDVSVAVDYKAMCNAFESNYITFKVEGAALFDSCSCALSDNPKGSILAKNLASLINNFVDRGDVTKIEIVGHSDPSGIESPCRRCKNVNENDQLSEYRALAFAQAVEKGLEGHSADKVGSRGAGSTQPVNGKRCAVDDADCYARSRRIEARLFLSEGAIDPQECVSKPVSRSGKKK